MKARGRLVTLVVAGAAAIGTPVTLVSADNQFCGLIALNCQYDSHDPIVVGGGGGGGGGGGSSSSSGSSSGSAGAGGG